MFTPLSSLEESKEWKEERHDDSSLWKVLLLFGIRDYQRYNAEVNSPYMSKRMANASLAFCLQVLYSQLFFFEREETREDANFLEHEHVKLVDELTLSNRR